MTSASEEGDPNSPICLLGEAPAAEEMREGRPFVGAAGGVLDRCLLTAGIDRSRCYIINTFPMRAQKSENGNISAGGEVLWTAKGPTEAGWEAWKLARARLDQCRANVLVPLGATALSFLCPATRGQIGKWRGSVLQAGDRKAIATYHPATVVWGSTHLQHVIATDLERVKEESLFPEIRQRSRLLLTDPTFELSVAALEHMRAAGKRFFFDLELFGGQLSAISLSNDPGQSISIPFITAERQHRWTSDEECTLLRKLADLLGDPDVPKGNQNVTFDCHILAKLYGMVVRGRLDDPMVLHGIVLPDLEKGLAFLCSWLTDVPYYKDDGGKRAWQDPFANIEAFWRYSALDACVALECFEELERQFLGEGSIYRKCYEETMELVQPLVFMMLRGMRVDQKGAKAAYAQAQEELAMLREKLRTTHEDIGPRKLPKKAPIGFNAASPKQCAELFYGKLGYPAYSTKGRVSTDVFALRRLARKGCWEAKTVLRCRSLAKQLDYLELAKANARMVTAYNIRGAKTGRLSSEENAFDEGRNTQNLTAAIKAFLVSDEA